LTLDVPRDLQLPRDREWMRALEDAEARQTTTLLRAADRRGTVDVTLDRRLTRRLMDEREALTPAIRWRRSPTGAPPADEYRNELQLALIALPDGRVLVSSSPSVKSP
jgi:hypothetical protein